MGVQTKVLIQSKIAENAQTSQYTTPAGTNTIIDKFTATNYSAATATLTVHLVPNGGTAGDGNLCPKTKSLAAGETWVFPEIVGHVLGPGDFISTLASAVTSIAIRSSGREVT